jgi:hypothetical protein
VRAIKLALKFIFFSVLGVAILGTISKLSRKITRRLIFFIFKGLAKLGWKLVLSLFTGIISKDRSFTSKILRLLSRSS